MELLKAGTNEYRFDNTETVNIYCHILDYVFPVDPEQSIYFEDKLEYKLSEASDLSKTWTALVKESIPCEDPEGKIIISIKPLLDNTRQGYIDNVKQQALEARATFIEGEGSLSEKLQEAYERSDEFKEQFAAIENRRAAAVQALNNANTLESLDTASVVVWDDLVNGG